jgi:hypothetical protein
MISREDLKEDAIDFLATAGTVVVLTVFCPPMIAFAFVKIGVKKLQQHMDSRGKLPL